MPTARRKRHFAMKIAFSGKASEPLADPSAEGAPPILSNKATDAERRGQRKFTAPI